MTQKTDISDYLCCRKVFNNCYRVPMSGGGIVPYLVNWSPTGIFSLEDLTGPVAIEGNTNNVTKARPMANTPPVLFGILLT
jgi:hypothetical protein